MSGVAATTEIIVCRSLDDAAPHMEAWSALAHDAVQGAAHGEWFAGPMWLLPLLRTYFSHESLSIFFVYEQGVLTGVVPLVATTAPYGGCRPSISLPINTHVRRIGWLARHSPERTLTHVLDAAFSASHYGVGCVALRQLRCDSELSLAVRTTARRTGLATNTFEETASAIIEIDGGWDAYVASRTSEQLHPLRKRRRMDKAGGWTFNRVDALEHFDEAWQRLLHIERRSWKHHAGTSIDNEPGASAFYHAVARAHAATGHLRLHVLAQHDVPVAHTLGVVYGHTYFLLKHSFDESYGQFSPGFQLMWHVMQESVESGCTRLDLLGDAMSWKVALSTSLPVYESYMVFPRTNIRCQQCRLKEQVLKPLGRRLGAKRLLDAIRTRAAQ